MNKEFTFYNDNCILFYSSSQIIKDSVAFFEKLNKLIVIKKNPTFAKTYALMDYDLHHELLHEKSFFGSICIKKYANGNFNDIDQNHLIQPEQSELIVHGNSR